MNRRQEMWGLFVVSTLALFAQLLFSARLKSPTVDEPNHLSRGYVYLKTGDLRFSRTTGHPPLLNAICALPLTMLDEIGSPEHYPGWQGGFLNAFATTFIFQNPVPLHRLVFLGRLPVMWITLLLAALLARWAGELYGVWGSALTLLFCSFDPNLIAHGRLATTDAGAALFFALTLYLFWRFLRRPSLPLLTASGVALGLAQCSKFSAILLLPIVALLGALELFNPNTALHLPKTAAPKWLSALPVLGGAMLAIVLLAALTIWAVYGFGVGAPAGWKIAIPAPQYIEGLRAILSRVSTDCPTFLLGRRLTEARWYYFLIALVLKTPLPLLIGVLLALLSNLKQRPRWRELPLGVLLAFYAASSAHSALNLGYRHLLPALPALWVYVGRIGCLAARRPRKWWGTGRVIPAILVLWLVVGTLHVAPDYLAYFNELAGGANGGRRYLVDSNLDWGQDLYAFREYVQAHPDTPIYLSWFGSTYPYLYDANLTYRHLAGHYSFPYANEMARSPYNPYRPEAGWYAISVTNLQMGVAEGDIFARFRTQAPAARIGRSILVYRVAATQPVDKPTCISGLDLNELDAPTRQYSLERGPGWVKWFDHRRSFVLPGAGDTAYVLPSPPLSFAPDWQTTFLNDAEQTHVQVETDRRPAAVVYNLAAAPAQAFRRSLRGSIHSAGLNWSAATRFDGAFEQHALTTPVRLGAGLELLGYRFVDEGTRKPGQTIAFVTVWQVVAAMPPSSGDLTAFVHLLDAGGQVRSGEDRLDLEPLTWQPGDLVVQLHTLRVPADAPPGVYQIELGLYLPDTMRRLSIFDGAAAIADRLLLPPVEVSSP